jgi:hypothetical protein
MKKATHDVVEPDPGEKMKSMLPGKNRIERSGRGLFLPEGREIEEIGQGAGRSRSQSEIKSLTQ